MFLKNYYYSISEISTFYDPNTQSWLVLVHSPFLTFQACTVAKLVLISVKSIKDPV